MPRRKQSNQPKAPRGTAANQRIEFSYHPSLNTPEGEVYQHLLRNPIWGMDQGKVMANECILARFLPYARQHNQPDLAKLTAQHSIRQLLRYIDELCRDFELPHPFAAEVALVKSPVLPASVPVATEDANSVASSLVEVDAKYSKFDLFEES